LNRHPTGYQAGLRFPPLTPGLKLIVLVTGVAYILEILWVHWIAPAALDSVAEAGPVFGIPVAIRAMHLAIHPPDLVRGQVWQLVTYLFVHDPTGPWHAILNLVFCWLFGAEFERRWGTRRFLRFYLTCGVVAGLFVVGWSALFPGDWQKFTLGASGAVYALIAAYGVIFPNRVLWPIPIKVKTFVWILVGLTVVYFLVQSNESVAAHLGGLLAGYLVTTGNWRPRRWLDLWRLRRLKKRRGRITVIRSDGERGSDGRNGRTLH